MKKQYHESLLALKKRADDTYDAGVPILTDDQYDAIFGESSTVGSETGDTPHAYPMYSLQKHYAEDGKPPLEGESLVETPKLDGCAVALQYIKGHLVLALTRGNGRLGTIISSKMAQLVPLELPELSEVEGVVQITGELVASSGMENSRNYVAGALGLKSVEDFIIKAYEGNMAFVAYGIQVSDKGPGLTDTYLKDMSILAGMGFTSIFNPNLGDFPTDGVVFRVAGNEYFRELGCTSKHPRGAYAFKVKQKPVETQLLGVEWNVGKSGKVTPVALLEPVIIGEAKISRATLNNMAYIEALGLEIGCTVELIRAGMIIPQVIGRVD